MDGWERGGWELGERGREEEEEVRDGLKLEVSCLATAVGNVSLWLIYCI